MKNKKLTEGNLLLNILIFSFPLMLSGILQLLFNAADTIVVGQFAGKTSLAAVGSTTPLIHLLINLFIGLAVGANVVAAHFIGAEKTKILLCCAGSAFVVCTILLMQKLRQYRTVVFSVFFTPHG